MTKLLALLITISCFSTAGANEKGKEYYCRGNQPYEWSVLIDENNRAKVNVFQKFYADAHLKSENLDNIEAVYIVRASSLFEETLVIIRGKEEIKGYFGEYSGVCYRI